MSIERDTRYRDNFTIIPNEILRCGTLSAKAIGIWTYLMSLPKDWRISLKEISSHFKEGYDAILAGMHELVTAGYAIKLKATNIQGKFDYGNWKIFDIKKKNPNRDNPELVFPEQENPPLLKTEIQPKTKTTNREAAPAAAAVFSCFKDVNIPQSDKEWLSKKYDEASCQHGIRYATHPAVEIKSTLVQTIKWAAANKPEIPVDVVAVAEENRKLAKSVEKRVIGNTSCVYAGTAGIEVYFAVGNVLPVVVSYEAKNFKELVQAAIKRFGVCLRE